MDLRLNYTPTSFVIRNAWLKGVVTAFDFEEYANSREDMRGKKVIDVWGKEWDLKDVDMIINRSMLKLSKHYKSLEHYLEECEKNNHGFSVTKYVHDEIDNERMLNYQYIQCLNLSDEDIDNLLQKDITEIKEVIGDNYIKSILYGRGKDLNHLAEGPRLLFMRFVDDFYHTAFARSHRTFRIGGLGTGAGGNGMQNDQRFRPVVDKDKLLDQIAAPTRDVAEIMGRIQEVQMRAPLHTAGQGLHAGRIGLFATGLRTPLSRSIRKHEQSRHQNQDLTHTQFILNT